MLVLILHDWCSSANRFVKLKNDLTSDGHHVVVFRFPGLGLEPTIWKRDLIGHYSGMVASYLKHNDVDCIIGHGMGAIIGDKALRILCTTDKVWTGKLIMVSPFYKGLRKLWIIPALRGWSIPVFREMIGVNGLSRLVSGFYVRNKESIDDLMLFDMRCADSECAVSLLDDINTNYWCAVPNTGRTYMICGCSDKLAIKRNVKSLVKDIKASDVTWLNCGHYPMIECYSEFLQTVRRYMNA